MATKTKFDFSALVAVKTDQQPTQKIANLAEIITSADSVELSTNGRYLKVIDDEDLYLLRISNAIFEGLSDGSIKMESVKAHAAVYAHDYEGNTYYNIGFPQGDAQTISQTINAKAPKLERKKVFEFID